MIFKHRRTMDKKQSQIFIKYNKAFMKIKFKKKNTTINKNKYLKILLP